MKTSFAMRKHLISATVLMSVSAVSALAYADADSYVELQFSAGTIGDFMRRELATQSSFCPQETSIGGKTVLVDHLDLGEAGALSRAPSASAVAINDFLSVDSGAVLYTQPMDVHIKSIECAKTPDCGTTTAIPASVTYELYTNSSGSVCMRSHSAAGLPEGLQPPELDVCLPFNADAAMLAAGLPGGTVSGSAVSLSLDGARLGVRIELGRTEADYDPERVDGWQSFADGDIEEAAATGDSSAFIHKSLILGAIQQRLADALSSHEGFTISNQIQTSWTDLGVNGARITAATSGVLSNMLCPNDIHVNDILLDAVVGPRSGAAGMDGLLIEGEVGYDVSNEDATACGLTLGGPLGGLILGSIAESISVPLDLGPGCSSNGDFRFECGQVTHPQFASLGPLQIGRFDLAGVTGASSGLVMSSTVRTSGSDAPTMDGQTSAFSFDETAAAYESSLRVTGTGKVCGVDFWASDDGDASLFVITAPSIPRLPYTVELPLSNAEAYAYQPFHMMAMVKTSAGVQTYELPDVGQ